MLSPLHIALKIPGLRLGKEKRERDKRKIVERERCREREQEI